LLHKVRNVILTDKVRVESIMLKFIAKYTEYSKIKYGFEFIMGTWGIANCVNSSSIGESYNKITCET